LTGGFTPVILLGLAILMKVIEKRYSMEAQFLQVANSPNRSFSLRREAIPNINSRWHRHAEVELIHFHRGGGTQFVGDNIRRFAAGDIVLVGSDLPHYWHYDTVEEHQESGESGPYATVLHFTEHFWGDKFLLLPENACIRKVLERAKRGLSLTGHVRENVAALMVKMQETEGPFRLTTLLECLYHASLADDRSALASIGFRYDTPESENERINAIYNYALQNFGQRITLEDVAAVAGLSPNSFCRYFKSRTGKHFRQFLTEIRIGHSCKRLIDGDENVKQICYESGFNNFSCFYKKFKEITGKTPAAYQSVFVR